MKFIPYALVVGSLMYAHTCPRPNISFAIGMFGKYQSNPTIDHWKVAKKVLRTRVVVKAWVGEISSTFQDVI
ncbi:hypothetical protein CR513_26253, partial [Mucuna pruriens]